MYDYIIIGAGLYGAVFANCARAAGCKCLVVERRPHIAGNCYTYKLDGIDVHNYGAHIFHTSNEQVWGYVNKFAKFNNFVNSPVANYKGRIFNLPFNMNTFYSMWGVQTPSAARKRIQEQVETLGIVHPKNLEEKALSLVGKDIYEMLIKGYTEKQWGRECRDLPPSIIERLPVRFTYDNNYFNDRFQGIPVDGYTELIRKMLEGVDVLLNVDFLSDREYFSRITRKILYTGPIDEFFDYCYGPLEYRSLHFETRVENCENFQGVAVMNYTDRETPYTRVIEHKHFTSVKVNKTILTFEYPTPWKLGDEPFYPVNDVANAALYESYKKLALKHPDIMFGGRLGLYRYFDMDKVVQESLCAARLEFGGVI